MYFPNKQRKAVGFLPF